MTATIRLATESDAPSIQAIYAPIVAETVISFEIEPPPVAEIARRMATISPHWPWLVCERGGAVLGYVYAGQHSERAAYRWSVDVTAYIHADARRAGVGRALYTSLFSLLALQGYFRAYAGITLPNAASVGLHEFMGFTPVGVYRDVGYKMAAWHDVGWWELALQSLVAAPEPPLTITAARRLPGWTGAVQNGMSLLRN